VVDPHTPREVRHGFDLEKDLPPLLAMLSALLSDAALGVVMVCRQGGISPTTLRNMMRHDFSIFGGRFESGELLLAADEKVPAVPCGAFCQWWKA
jgi:hypothetical protein